MCEIYWPWVAQLLTAISTVGIFVVAALTLKYEIGSRRTVTVQKKEIESKENEIAGLRMEDEIMTKYVEFWMVEPGDGEPETNRAQLPGLASKVADSLRLPEKLVEETITRKLKKGFVVGQY
jgi:hypothetical protein